MFTPAQFKAEVLDNLQNNIMPYWINKMVDPRGGFYGRRDGNDVLDENAPKGAILNGRLLWSFSAAYRTTGRQEYLQMALRAKQYIIDHFYDKEYGGVYWSVNADGTPLDTKKQFYAIGFCIYGFSELYRASGDTEALDYAVRLYRDIEEFSHDYDNLGYLEAATRDWKPIEDMRLSDKDDNAAKTMNTHLHIIEPYTNLYRVWPDEELRTNIIELQELFLDVMEDSDNHHLGLFFDMGWQREDHNESFGHDIEATWLLLETAQVLLEVDTRMGDTVHIVQDKTLLEKTLQHTESIAYASFEGRNADGSMVYEKFGDGSYNANLDWWVQAEQVIGQVYLWKFHGKEDMLEKAYQTWTYIKENIVDNENGEWYWGRLAADGSINRKDDKAGFWKCPYHNSRMCMEVAAQLS